MNTEVESGVMGLTQRQFQRVLHKGTMFESFSGLLPPILTAN